MQANSIKMKTVITILIISMALLSVTSCGYRAYKHYYNDIENYEEIWELSGFYHGYEDKSTFFPNDITSLNVKSFFCRYDEELPLGENVQLLLEVQYNKETYASETERLSALGFECSKNFDLKGTDAYATNLGTLGVKAYISEYALLNNEDYSVKYIFLHGIPKEEIEFDHKLIPIGYTQYGEIVEGE